MSNNNPIEAIKFNGFNDAYANFKLNLFKKKEAQSDQSAFVAYNNNPDRQVHNVTLSNGAPNSVMTT